MSHVSVTSRATLAVVVGMVVASGSMTARQPTPDAQLAALKQNLADSQKRLRQYEWIETTIVSHKGEEKARKQQRCYYGADGKVQKVPIESQPQPQAQQGGGRGARLKKKIVENKKEEMQDYMERAAGLVHRYVPPTPAQVQSAKDGGRMSVRQGAPGRVSLEFTGYLLNGDRLSVEIDTAASRLLGLNVATYLDKPEDKVTLGVQMGSLPDGTTFNQQITLDAAAEHIRVVIQNNGHRSMAR